MQFRLTAVHERDRTSSDVEVTGAAGYTLADLASALPGGCSAARCPDGSWTVAGQPLSPEAALGQPPLLEGAVLTHRCSGGLSEVPSPGAPLLVLHVIEGPDCGATHPLPLGTHRLGRSQGSLRINDPDLSRLHCEITVAHERVTVRDLGSTNGSRLEGTLVRGVREWQPGQRLRIGGTTLALRLPREPRGAITADANGHLAYHRGPRRHPALPAPTLRMPTPPTTAHRQRLPLAMVVLPLVVSGVVAAVLHSATMLLFGLLGPVMLLSSWISDRRNGRASARQQQREYRWAIEQFTVEREEALHLELRERRASSPDPADLAAQVEQAGARLWHRRPGDPDFLRLRVGTGDVPAALTVQPAATHEAAQHPLLAEAPVTVSLGEAGVIGVAGPRAELLACARGLVGQVAGWHSPSEVSVVVLTAEDRCDADWSWASWLPHFCVAGERLAGHGAALGEDGRALDDAGGARDGTDRTVVVVLDGAKALRARPGIPELLRRALEGDSRVHVLALDREAHQLPTETRVSVLLDDARTARLEHPDLTLSFRPDLVSPPWAERLSRGLAPLRDATPTSPTNDLPRRVRLLDLLDRDATDPAALADRWRARSRSTTAVVGRTADSPFVLDLSRDGPHVLVAGTTGAGKSELLQTLIASLALGNQPDELCFVLIDYKGGSAFKACAELPHTVGLVTDLDEHLAGRALASLEAELKRRERIFRDVGAIDLPEYQRVSHSTDPPVPRLVLVIDEFRVLAEEQPAFLDGLVRIAAVGRSLGVHLVLATQRPAGVVTADIKANVNLRIALRVRDRVDSEDVVEAPDAATLPDDCPGRAVARIAAEPLQTFHAARVGGGPDRSSQRRLVVRLLGSEEPEQSVGPVAAEERHTEEPTDLERVAGATREAAQLLTIPQVPSPWLPPLPEILPLPGVVTLPDVVTSAEESPSSRSGSPLPRSSMFESPLSVPYAVADLPQAQCRRTLAWDLAGGGHLAVVGAPRSGRTTVARTIAGAVARQLSSADAHLFVLDGGGSLSVLAALPHCGAVVGRDEVARGRRLVRRLAEEVDRRRRLLAAGGHGSVEEQRAVASTTTVPGTPPMPYLLLLVDGWEVFAQTYEPLHHGAVVDQLLQLLRDGPAAGLRVLLTGDRSLLSPRLAGAVAEKICLRLGDETELLLAGVPREAVPGTMPPGRGIRLDDAVELQVCLLDADPSAAAQNERLLDLARRSTPRAPAPFRVDPLPSRVTTTQLRDRGASGEAPRDAAPTTDESRQAGTSVNRVLLGLDADTLGPALLEVPPTGLGLLVVGGPGTGKSVTVATLAEGLRRTGRSVLHVAGGDPERIEEQLRAHPDAHVLVDDVVDLLDHPVEQVLLDHLARQRRTGALVAAAADPADVASRYRGLVAELRRTRSGVLLCTEAPTDGELLGIPRVPVDDERVPGRGLLAIRGRVTALQVALPSRLET
ncbi:MAG TPA: FtsK/SpoIIIE domain-containing protein [Segeticoccus sp.]|uniref:FtsK/SpoIIIE domain-containing protein n=1 Tax=Segeticoccus sp. TaxID=2706531 RepID=UPI002D7E73DF|nr:FtsK/SpoIIIE domain-containing protein [Segeticoccus sp.]HET8601665.1 FtsK/SpoIIIE domain-containing protein [Segeticoccus sp.]